MFFGRQILSRTYPLKEVLLCGKTLLQVNPPPFGNKFKIVHDIVNVSYSMYNGNHSCARTRPPFPRTFLYFFGGVPRFDLRGWGSW
jgi:hypothetical protein